jgi:hypothetical protein
MNGKKFNELVGNFDTHDETSVSKMALLIEKYPYFQLPRFFYTKSLKDQNKDDLDNALHQLALYTYDRSILKKSIESALEYPKKIEELVKPNKKTTKEPINKIKDPIQSIKEESSAKVVKKKPDQKIKVEENEQFSKGKNTPKKITVNPKKKQVADKEVSTTDNQSSPPPKDAKLSFIDWIEFTEDNQKAKTDFDRVEQNQPLSDKLTIINRFIDANPKISPVGKTENVYSVVKEDLYSDELMTETLAKLLVKQKKYKKAISAYKILSLKYPEKNVFFAGQIQKIKNLQQQ